MKKMSDNTYSECLQKEKEKVIAHYRRDIRKKSLMAGLCLIAITLCICLIVNIATKKAVDWFFIVLAGLLVFASITIVPHMLCDENTTEQRHGLGLLIVKQIASVHGGTVSIERSICNGFAVKLTFPITDVV